MHATHTSLFLPAMLLAAAAHAQVLPGDLGVTGFSTTQFSTLSSAGAPTGYTTSGFLGTGTSQSILWDPNDTQSFLIGGFGFVGRATITGPGAATYAFIGSVNTACQMSFDAAGQLIIADAGTDQIRRMDPTTGTVVDLTVGPQPWGTSVNAGAYEPATGDVIVGNQGGIFRLVLSTSTVTTIATGLGGFLSGIAFDPLNGDIIATVLTANRLVRVTSAGTVTDIMTPGAVSGPNAVDITQDGSFVLAGSTGRVFIVPYAGGGATVFGTISAPTGTTSGVSVARFGGYAIPYGTACAAVSGPTTLSGSGLVAIGGNLTLTSGNHAPATLGVQTFGFSNTTHQNFPLPLLLDPLLGTNNCFLHASIDTTLILFTDAGTPASLSYTLSFTPAFAGFRLYAQQAVFEAVPGGLSWTNGVAVIIP